MQVKIPTSIHEFCSLSLMVLLRVGWIICGVICRERDIERELKMQTLMSHLLCTCVSALK